MSFNDFSKSKTTPNSEKTDGKPTPPSEKAAAPKEKVTKPGS